MDAIYQNLINQDRVKLEEAVPLSTPFSIALDPCNICNFRCGFCAAQVRKHETKFKRIRMDFVLFKKIIDDLKQFPDKLKILRINGNGEPLLNPDFPEMVRYARKANIAEKIETITNGSLLNPELNQKLIDSGLDRIRISIESLDSYGYEQVSGVKVNIEQMINNIRDLHDRSGKCEIYCKIVDAAVPTQKQRDKFFELFRDVCDRYFIDHVIPLWSDFPEINNTIINSESGGLHGQKIKDVKICPYPFYSLLINPDGEVTMCCADWKREYVIGNVAKESLQSIWNGERLLQFLSRQCENGRSSIPMCRKCELPAWDCIDDIDDFGDVILSKLRSKGECSSQKRGDLF